MCDKHLAVTPRNKIAKLLFSDEEEEEVNQGIAIREMEETQKTLK